MAPQEARDSRQVAAILASKIACRVAPAIHPPQRRRSKSPNPPTKASAAKFFQTCPWFALFPPNAQRCRRPHAHGSLIGTVQSFRIAGFDFDEAPLLRDDVQQLCSSQLVSFSDHV